MVAPLTVGLVSPGGPGGSCFPRVGLYTGVWREPSTSEGKLGKKYNEINVAFILVETEGFGGGPVGTKQSEDVPLCGVVLKIPI